MLAALLPIAALATDPQPADLMPRAAQTITLDVTQAGTRFVAVGDRGHVLVSDNGSDWTQKPTPVRRMLNRVRFVDEKLGWAVGYDHAILHTTDGGEHWTLQHFDAESGRANFDVLFLDARRGFVTGANGFFKRTVDGGATWTDVQAEFLTLGLHLFNLVRLNDGTLLIAGERGLLARSTDEGDAWAMLQSPYAGSWFGALPYGERGFVGFGLRGNIYVAEDVGALATQNPAKWDEFDVSSVTDPAELAALHWRQVDNPVSQSLFGGARLADGRHVFVGINGTVLVGDTALTMLKPVPYPADAPLSDVLPNDGQLILAGRMGLATMQQATLP